VTIQKIQSLNINDLRKLPPFRHNLAQFPTIQNPRVSASRNRGEELNIQNRPALTPYASKSPSHFLTFAHSHI
jgi:hypothetical protein